MRRRPLPPVREENPAKSWSSYCDCDWLIYCTVSLIGGLCYVNSLYGEFVHDDIPAIVSNKDVSGETPFLQIFANDFWGTLMADPMSHKSYRPLTTLTFRLNFALSGLSPFWWHATNVLLHAACCALVARTAVVVARLSQRCAAVAALLFAVHPVHTEAVAGVVGRADVLACVFFLSSILIYHGSGRHRMLRSVALAALSMLAKETGMTALMVNVALDVYRCWVDRFTRPSVKWRTRLTDTTARVGRLAAWIAVLLAVRLALLQGSLPAFSAQDNPAAFHPSFVVRLMTFCYLAAFNWWLLLCPWTLSHDWQMGSIPLVTTVMDVRNFVTCAALATLLAIGYACVTNLESQRHTPLVVGLLLMVLPYLPASNMFFTVGFVVAERVLYMPSVGWSIMVAHAFSRWRRRRWAALGAAALLLAGAARVATRNRAWSCRESLLRADLAVLPHNAKLHYNLANFLKDVDQTDSAIKHYKEAIRLWPWYASAHNNLGTVVSEGAETHFLRALAADGSHSNARYNLAKLYRAQNRMEDAVHLLERCIELNPRFVPAYLELSNLKPMKERGEMIRKLISLEPRNWEHWLAYGGWISESGWNTPSLAAYLTAARFTLIRSGAGAGATAGEGTLVSVRGAARALRRAGQRSRLLQLMTRWHHIRASREPPAVAASRRRRLALWRLQAELDGRAKQYTLTYKHETTTCLHHSHLELSSTQQNTLTYQKTDCKVTDTFSEVHINKVKVDSKKDVTLASTYKKHNKSESSLKRNSCPLNKGKDSQSVDYSNQITDQLIKTF